MDTTAWIFAALMVVGIMYFIIQIFFGGLEGLGFEGADSLDIDLDTDVDAGGVDAGAEGKQLGFVAFAAFLAMFGAVGLVGSISGWQLIQSLIVAVIVGIVAAQAVAALLRFVWRQQSKGQMQKTQEFIGMTARVTIDSAAGTTGEVMVEDEFAVKYPVKEVDGAALKRGEIVHIVDHNGPYLYVKKQAS